MRGSFVKIIVAASAALALTACGSNDKQGFRTGDIESGGLSFGGGKKKGGGEAGIGVNSFLWRATLDTVNFMPLSSADPFGGVIISEWYVAPSSPNERLKVTVYIMDRALRADGLKVVVFRQTRSTAGWQDATPSPDTAHKLEDSILTRARELRLATLGQVG